MKPFSTLAKRVLIGCSVLLVTACGSKSITEPTSAKSGYLTVSASVKRPTSAIAPSSPVPSSSGPSSLTPTSTTGQQSPQSTAKSGYNVPAN